MAKKIYHIPIDEARVFIKQNRPKLHKLLEDREYLQYSLKFGKTHYDIQIENFIIFFKIDKNIPYALKTINHLHSSNFLEQIFLLLNFNQFDFKKQNIAQKDFFYGLCYVLHKEDEELFIRLFEQLFLHFHSSLNNDTDTNIDFKEMAKELSKSKKLNIKESFGEENNQGYFKIYLDEKLYINLKGKSIKTVRKKAYRQLFYILLDFDENGERLKQQSEVYELLEQMKQ
ncbi:MAG: hypothetical protein JJV88_05550 [Sulfurovum sp.]|nr:hypothetical protein [Sulfurovaceae bacterium]